MIDPRYILKDHWLANLAPKNPTQTMYRRFKRGFTGPFRSRFDDLQDDFDKKMDDALKTPYTKNLDVEFENG